MSTSLLRGHRDTSVVVESPGRRTHGRHGAEFKAQVGLAIEPVELIDLRAGAERLLARVVQVFGAAQAHHGYLFSNARSTRIKLLVHDGFGVWCAARRLNKGSFEWPRGTACGTARM